jgi:hypothetical protein
VLAGDGAGFPGGRAVAAAVSASAARCWGGGATRHLLGALDVLVLTSLWEGLPRVCRRRWRQGHDVARAVDRTPEAVVDGRNGFLLKRGDYRAAESVLRLAGDPAPPPGSGRRTRGRCGVR